jgi:VWFA-related protein
VFRAIANSVSTNVLARDDKGQFVPDLRQDEFQVFEDGVPQKLTTFLTFVGGRATGTPLTTVAGPPVAEGLVLPRTVPPPDASGRIFIIFIDDLHIAPGLTPKARFLLQQIRDTIVKDNDLVGFVSSGYSSIATDIQYDYHHQRFDAAIKKTTGGALSSDDIIKSPAGQEGPAGIRYMARTAFSTAMDILKQAEKITNRRKSFIYLSTGYDFDPYKDSRLKYIQDMYGVPDKNADGTPVTQTDTSNQNYTDPFAKLGDSFAETDLIAEVAEIVREANRANVTFYPVDPRGLVGMMDINEQLTYEEWHENLLVTTSSLMVLGEQTGGFCVCMRNDYKQAFQRIDAETSDYYMIGYNSTNPDPLKYVRKIEIKITRPGVRAENYRTEYTLKRPSKKDK